MTKHLISIADLKKLEIEWLLKKAQDLKKNPKKYHKALYEKVLMTFFQMPSLRTEVSFDVAMFKMGGEIVDYHSETSPWAAGKESVEDVGKVISRYVDAVMVRMHDHEELKKLAKNAKIPVINGLTSYEHPCQVLSDLQTIKENFKRLNVKSFKDLKLTYFGDARNNVTHSLILACAIMGMNISIACPNKKEYMPNPEIIRLALKLAKKYHTKSHKFKVEITNEPERAIKGADIVYTDSWMSYRIPKEEKPRRVKDLFKFQVDKNLMKHAKHTAIFMHDLPALRGQEVSKDVIDGKQSVVFDQAENRMHMEKAILLWFLKNK